jgi:hypothetical protein
MFAQIVIRGRGMLRVMMHHQTIRSATQSSVLLTNECGKINVQIAMLVK